MAVLLMLSRYRCAMDGWSVDRRRSLPAAHPFDALRATAPVRGGSTTQHDLDPTMGGGDVSDPTGPRARKARPASVPGVAIGLRFTARDQLVVGVQDGQTAVP